MTDADSEVAIVAVLRDILVELVKLSGAVERLGIRLMTIIAAGQRAELHADDVAVDLAYAHAAADEVPEGAPPGSRADAAVGLSPTERWNETAP